MPSVWFIVPAHGRVELARICLRQLRRTCDELRRHRIEATAVVVACDENLDTALELGFGTVERDNRFLSRKFNDGIQFATDPTVNLRPADYVVPCGSDDWVDWRLFLNLPDKRTVVGFRSLSFVREDGQQISATRLGNVGGAGIRIYPRDLMERADWRPADEDRKRACDTSILYNLQRIWGHDLKVDDTRHLHDRQIVDWKTSGEQLNPFETIGRRHKHTMDGDPFVELAGIYPAEALEEMRAHYAGRLVAA